MTSHNDLEPQAEFDAELVQRVVENILSFEREKINELRPRMVDKIIEIVQDEIK